MERKPAQDANTSRNGRHANGHTGRAHAITNVLSDPESPIHNLASSFLNYIYMPDPTPLYVVMGAMAGNMMSGNPVWLMLVGESGSGKTMLLKSLCSLPKVRTVSSIKGEAALLSGVKKKDRAKDATGGVLCELGENGCLIFMDFTGVLSKSREAVNELLGVFRELYDRTWTRDIGGEGGRSLSHTGRVCMLGGVTHAIDRHHEVSGEMGQRCLFYRMPVTDGYHEAMAALSRVKPEEDEAAMRQLVQTMFYTLDLSFERPTVPEELELAHKDRIVSLAQLGAKLRSGVPRHWRDHHVMDVPAEEVATRMAQELTQLWHGMGKLGVLEEEKWHAVEKVALDSMPLLRRRVLGAVKEAQEKGEPGPGTAKIGRVVKVSESAARRTVEDLELLGVVRRLGEGWRLTDWAGERMEKAEVEEV